MKAGSHARAFCEFQAEIQEVANLYRRQGGRGNYFQELLWDREYRDPSAAAKAAMRRPPELVYRNFRECYDRANEAGKRLLQILDMPEDVPPEPEPNVPRAVRASAVAAANKRTNALEVLEEAVSDLASVTRRAVDTADKNFGHLCDTWARFSDALAVSLEGKATQRFRTQVGNLLSKARQGSSLRAYNTYSPDTPVDKAVSALRSIAKAIGSNEILNRQLRGEVASALDTLGKTTRAWCDQATKRGSVIMELVAKTRVQPEPSRSGFSEDASWDYWIRSQQEFAKQINTVTDRINKCAIGLSSGISPECADVDKCLQMLTEDTRSAAQLNRAFNERWGLQ